MCKVEEERRANDSSNFVTSKSSSGSGSSKTDFSSSFSTSS